MWNVTYDGAELKGTDIWSFDVRNNYKKWPKFVNLSRLLAE